MIAWCAGFRRCSSALGWWRVVLHGAHCVQGCAVSLRQPQVLHLSTILASFILRTFLVSYLGVLENLGKAFKLSYVKMHSVANEGIVRATTGQLGRQQNNGARQQ